MRYVNVMAVMASLLALSSIMLIGSVDGDIEPNGEQYLAESIEDGTITGSLYSTSEDYLDWYVMDIPPFTTVVVTLRLTSPSGQIDATSYWDDLEIDGSISLSVTNSGPDESDVFRSDTDFEEIWIKVSGDGSYELDITFEQDFLGGCCGGFVLLGGLPLIGGFIFIRYRKRRSPSRELIS